MQVRVWVAVRPSVQQVTRLGFLDTHTVTRVPFPLTKYFAFQVVAVTL